MAKHCKCKHEECEECPEWIFTFADLVMLMMGFFVILWVLKPNPTPPQPKVAGDASADPAAAAAAQAAQEAQDKWLDTVGSIRTGFGYVPKPGSEDPVDKA